MPQRSLQRRAGIECQRDHDRERREHPLRRDLGGAPNQSFYVEDDAFDVGDSFDPLQNATTSSTNLSGTLVYARQDGGVVTVDFLAEESASGCVFAGTAIG